ncbi:hypothetical protein MJO28_004024 [Puccinia striiformis f. sp. tritici]|nr:hypothetical protein MJO28_004024 [Puccinia striiformis f. sp. tritici]KAI7963861.1 hypothetical protein MJO29_004288 [Puccinia striiformis f. sp. tritici]POV98148.1 hypothetical protein PSTT_14603 [Puccinia striiformis]
MGYGTQAIQILTSYFNGQLISLSKDVTKDPAKSTAANHAKREPAMEKDGNLMSMRDINELSLPAENQ